MTDTPADLEQGAVFTPEAIAAAQVETERLSRELDITNADHIALWLEANLGDASLGWLAVRIVEAHEVAFAQPPASGVDREAVADARAWLEQMALDNAADAQEGGTFDHVLNQRVNTALAALTNSGAPVPGDGALLSDEAKGDIARRAVDKMLKQFVVMGRVTRSDLEVAASYGVAEALKAANPVPGDAGGRAAIEALRDLADAARSACDAKQHQSLIDALAEADAVLIAHAAPAPSDGPITDADCILSHIETEAAVPAGMVLVPVGLLYAAVETYEGEWGEANNPDSWPNRMKAMLAYTPKQATPNDEAVLADHIREQITHVQQRIEDGRAMGATVWRIALEDVVRENKAILAARSAPGSAAGEGTSS